MSRGIDPSELQHDDETLDELRVGGLKIFQKKSGYRFSIDPVLLCSFVRLDARDKVVDLGTGSGIIPLLLAARSSFSSIVGVEIQPQLADRARRNVILNGMEEKVQILQMDLRDLRSKLHSQAYNVVLTNPPYRSVGTGRQAPQTERARARHELAGGLAEFVHGAACLLGDGGRFYIVYLAERLAELLAAMRREKLEPKRMRCVHSRKGEPARMVLVEGRKGGGVGLAIDPPLYIYEGQEYTEEILAVYGEM